MTCIVGYVEKGVVYLGGDSCCGNASYYTQNITVEPKVFKIGEFVIGYTTSFRMGQILKYRFSPPKHIKTKSNMHYLTTEFVEKLQATFAKYKFGSSQNEPEIAIQVVHLAVSF